MTRVHYPPALFSWPPRWGRGFRLGQRSSTPVRSRSGRCTAGFSIGVVESIFLENVHFLVPVVVPEVSLGFRVDHEVLESFSLALKGELELRQGVSRSQEDRSVLLGFSLQTRSTLEFHLRGTPNPPVVFVWLFGAVSGQ